MEDVARAAGVGKGTLYRRYPDRAALAVALLGSPEHLAVALGELARRILS